MLEAYKYAGFSWRVVVSVYGQLFYVLILWFDNVQLNLYCVFWVQLWKSCKKMPPDSISEHQFSLEACSKTTPNIGMLYILFVFCLTDVKLFPPALSFPMT